MIVVNFPEGINKVTAPPLYQWDYGQKLKITGAGVQFCQVHFCDRTCDETVVRAAGVTDDATGIEVAIPDRLLENEYPINAFIYECAENSGQTLKHIIIPIIKRKRPEDFIDPVPESIQTQMEQMIANANSAINTIQEYYGATLTFVELYDLIQEQVDTKIDGINQTTEDYWKSVETVIEENQELKKVDAALDNKITEVNNNIARVDRYVPIDFKQKVLANAFGTPGTDLELGVKLPSGEYEITAEVTGSIVEKDEEYIGNVYKCRGIKREKGRTYLKCLYDEYPDFTLCLYPAGDSAGAEHSDAINGYFSAEGGTPLYIKIIQICKIERGSV